MNKPATTRNTGRIAEIHTPDSLANILNNTLQSPIDRRRFLIEGVYADGKGKLYGQSYYDTLVDTATQRKLTLRVPKTLKPQLLDGLRYTFSGYLNRSIPNRPDLGISLHFNIVEVVGDAGRPPIDDGGGADLLAKKSESGFKNVEKFIFSQLSQDKKVVVHLIVGNEAITDNDLILGMGDALSVYDLQEHRINLNDVEEIVSRITGLDQEDECIIAVVRGGGELAIFDDERIAGRVLSLDNILVTAIGHTTDVSLLDRVADRSFATPSFLGAFFKEAVARVAQSTEDSDRRDSTVKRLREDNDRLRRANDRLTRMITQKDRVLDGIRDSVSSTERIVNLVSSRMIQVASRYSIRNLVISFLLGVIVTTYFSDIVEAMRALL